MKASTLNEMVMIKWKETAFHIKYNLIRRVKPKS